MTQWRSSVRSDGFFFFRTMLPSPRIRWTRHLYESASFWIRSPEWTFLNTLWIRNRVDAKPRFFFFFNPVTLNGRSQFFTVNTVFKKVISTPALVPIFSEESWILEWIRIRVGYVGTNKFDLNRNTCGNFWIRKEKVADLKISGYV